MTTNQELSYDAKLVMVLVLLFVLYPVGLILMFKWMNWPKWVKWLIAFPVVLMVLGILAVFSISFLATFNPGAQMERARDSANKIEIENLCLKECAVENFGVDFDTCALNCKIVR